MENVKGRKEDGNTMTPFAILFVIHYVQDWIFQRKKTAYGKLMDQWTRLGHCMWYALPISIAFILMFFPLGFNFRSSFHLVTWWAAYIYFVASHFIVDTPRTKQWIFKCIKKEDNPPEWLAVKIDEILHIVTLVPPALILGGIIMM